MLKSLHRRHSSWQLCQGRGNLPALSNESSSINVCKPLLLFHCKRLHKSVDTFTSSAIHRLVTMWTSQSEYKFQCRCFIEANSEAKKKLKIQDRSSEILNVILCGKRWLDDKERLAFNLYQLLCKQIMFQRTCAIPQAKLTIYKSSKAAR